MAIDFGVDDALEEISEQVRDGRCILFLGSAVHARPPPGSPFSYPVEQRPAMAGELSEALARRCAQYAHFDARRDTALQRVALFYELGRSRRQLIDEISQWVQQDKRPSPMLRALAELNFPVVLTTNYDDLYEQALREQGKDPLVFVYSRNRCPRVTTEQLTGERPVVFKLHGDLLRRESIVVTEDDYIDFVGQMTAKRDQHPIPLALKSLMKTWATLFLGYSLADYNLRILFRLLHWKTDEALYPPMYSVDRSPDALIRAVWEGRRRYLRFVVEDVWKFVPELYEQVTGEELQP
jgi:hypothetical protein